MRRGAVAQHGEAPAHQAHVQVRADDQRPVLHQQPLDRLQRHARSGPGRRVTRRHLAGIGVAGFLAGRVLAVDHRDLVAGLRQKPRARHADDAAAQNDDLHARHSLPNRCVSLSRATGNNSLQISTMREIGRIFFRYEISQPTNIQRHRPDAFRRHNRPVISTEHRRP